MVIIGQINSRDSEFKTWSRTTPETDSSDLQESGIESQLGMKQSTDELCLEGKGSEAY